MNALPPTEEAAGDENFRLAVNRKTGFEMAPDASRAPSSSSSDGHVNNTFSHVDNKCFSESILKINLPDDDMCDMNLMFSELKGSNGEDSTDISSDIFNQNLSLSNNVAAGYIGEKLAFKMLQRLFTGRDDVIKVEWLNVEKEQGHPYDISIQYKSARLQKCEVKTHIVSPAQSLASVHTQWFMSPQEVKTAIVEKADFFCVFITAVLEESGVDGPRLLQRKSQIVGLEHGFMNAIQAKDISLIVQVNTGHNN